MKPKRKKLYYHFTHDTLRDGSPIPPKGRWLSVKGRLSMCGWGLHASAHPYDALCYAPGATLHLVELGGKILRGEDKVCARRRKIVATIDARGLMDKFARECALSVLHLWSRAPKVVARYLKTGDLAIQNAAYMAAHGAWMLTPRLGSTRRAISAVYVACDPTRSWQRRARHGADEASYALAYTTGRFDGRYDPAAAWAERTKHRKLFKQMVTAAFKKERSK